MKKLKNLVDNQTLNFRKNGVAWIKIRVDKKAKKVLLETVVTHLSRWFEWNKEAYQVGVLSKPKK